MAREATVKAQSAHVPSGPLKPAKATAVDAAKYVALLTALPVKLAPVEDQGQRAITTTALAAGAELAVESVAASVVRHPFVKHVCFTCRTVLPRNSEGTPTAHASCDKCGLAFYCSQDCQDKSAALHGLECEASQKLAEIKQTHSVDLDLLRLTLRIVAMQALQQEAAQSPVLGEFTPAQYINDIPTHRDSFDEQWVQVVSAAAVDLVSALPSTLPATVDDVVDLACRINVYAYGFSDIKSRNTNECVGLFPMLSTFLTHSCDPNCLLVAKDNGCLTVRSLKPIQEGEAVTVSYVDLYQPREQRRRDLLMAKHFWCKCPRCNSMLSESVDRFMDGILCRRCKRGVMIFEETKEVDDINALMKDVSILDDEIKGKRAKCERCPATMSVTELVDILKNAIEDYAKSMLLVRQRKLPESRQALEAYLRKYEKGRLLHTNNSYLLNTLIPLMNTCVAQGDLHTAVTCNKAIVERMTESHALPEFAPEVAEFRYHLGDLYMRMVNKKGTAKTKAGQTLLVRYQKEAKNAFALAHRAYLVAYGPYHPKTQLAAVRRNRIQVK
ncbi:hypothetical protein H4R34_003907 [Dimargaris verticillata]|uniref:SET domain-containing protein n=1 Tax=Dimargaris verticillata TaxID=2761393 RepID=A0A9W8EC66_9FUNG|nr:hypothetical protein H4R34_003907 [Dimargaris verticillata]